MAVKLLYMLQNLCTNENCQLSVDVQQDRDLSESSNSVSDLNARLKNSQQLIAELRSSEAELKKTNAESGIKIAELIRDVEHLKSMFTSLCDLFNLLCCSQISIVQQEFVRRVLQ